MPVFYQTRSFYGKSIQESKLSERHRSNLLHVFLSPAWQPYFCIAKIAYSEQVGWNLQAILREIKGEITFW
jgi:hypothetical protein